MSPRQLPVVSGKRIVRALEKAGFEVVSTRGSHCKLRHVSPPRIVIVPLHDEVRPGTLASVLRQAGMTVGQLRDLL
jgi:predicted RNA binding protein YcfA (HicA-like mRNA interferase family)